MADISITTANCAPGQGATYNRDHNAGATVTAGQPVYLDASNLWQLATGAGTALQASAYGIAAHAALAGQPLAVQTGGQMTLGGTLVLGSVYYVSINNPGGVMLAADFATGNHVTELGIAISTTVLQLDIRILTGTHA